MSAPSIKKNFFYSSFITTANYLFTFITYPYVSRVLGVDKIGAVNFVDSVINYFIMLSMLGIAIVGIREVARSKTDRNELNSTFSSLFYINLFFTAIALLILGGVYLFLPELQQHGELVGIGVAKLVANIFLMDWFFKGIENFKIITIRTFIVRMLYVAAIFIFVHSQEDYVAYFLLTALSVVANAVVNCLYMRRFVSLSMKNLQIMKFLSPVVILGLYMFFGNFYSTFNTMFLGVEKGDTEVGYFSTATKLFTIILSLYGAFTTVMMPRMSSLLKEGKLAEYTALFRKSVSIVFAFCLPLVLLTVMQSGNIILLISGEGYDGAIVPMMLCMPLLVIVGYNQILMNQGLMPIGKDKAILLSSVFGGLVALALCYLLIPHYGSKGAAVVWLCSELVVNAVAGYFVYRYISIPPPVVQLLKAVVLHLPLLVLLYLTRELTSSYILNLCIASALTFVYCFVLQCFIVKDETVRRLFGMKK